jgi:hypothetical protein
MSDKKLTEEEAFDQLIKALEALGWSMAMPSVADDSEVPGMVIGKAGYIDFVTEHLPEDVNWDEIDFYDEDEYV